MAIAGRICRATALYQAALNVVAIDPSDSQTFYAGVSATNARKAEENGAGIYKSVDGGQKWSRIASIAGVSVYCLAIWEKDGHVMVAGTNQGVYRSSDSGESWEHISPDGELRTSGVMSIAIDPKHSERDLCRNASSSMEDDRRRKILAHHPYRDD